MASKRLIMIGMLLGSTLGAYIPALWGVGVFSFVSIVFSLAGGILGIWLGFKIGQQW